MEFFTSLWKDIASDGWVAIFSLLAILLNAIAYQQKTKRAILLTVVAAMTVVGFYYLLKGAYAGALMNWISVARSLTFHRRDEGDRWAQSPLFLFGFLFLFFTAGIYSATVGGEGGMAFLSVSGMTFATLAMWVKKPLHVRLLSLPGMLSWFTYNSLNHMWLLIVSDIVCLASLVIGLIRYDLLPFLCQHFRISEEKAQKNERQGKNDIVQ